MKKIFLLAFILLCTGSSVLFSQVMGYVMVVHQAGCDNQSGILKAQFGGGNGIYTYLWSNGSTNDTIYNLSAGTYTVTCYSNGQTGTATWTLSSFGLDTIETRPACNGLNNGWIEVDFSASNPIHFDWYLNGNPINEHEHQIDSASAGIYKYVLTDYTGCKDSGTVEIKASSPVMYAYSNDSTLCWGQSTNIWFTPGFSFYDGSFYLGSSTTDTFSYWNSPGGASNIPPGAPYDSIGCMAIIQNSPIVYTQGHPDPLLLFEYNDTVFIQWLSPAYDSVNSYYWQGPHGSQTTHLTYYVMDTTGTYSVSKINPYGCSVFGSVYAYYTSVNDLEKETFGFTIEPNPAVDELNVSVTDNFSGKEISVYDVSGRKISTQLILQSKFKLRVTNFAKGVYLLKAGEAVRKFTKE